MGRTKSSSRRQSADSEAAPANPPTGLVLKRVVVLLAIAVLAAVGISVLTAYLTPLDELPEEAPAGMAEVLPHAPKADPNPTIQIPIFPADISAEDLRTELLGLAQELLDKFPESPDALHVAALLYADLQRTQEAEPIWEKCITLAPDQPGPYIGLATTAMELGKYEEALGILRQAAEAGCSSQDLYYETASALSKLGQLDEAETTLHDGLSLFPHAAENWLQLGQIQIQLSRFEEAEGSLLRAIQEGTPTISVYFSLATACARLGKTEEAADYRKTFADYRAKETARSEDPFQKRYDAELRRVAVAATCRAGTVYEHHGQPNKAEQALLRALDFGPGNAVVCGELVRLFRNQGRIADALLVQGRLVEIEGDDVTHYANLASLASQLGDYRLAESTLQQVISMRPDMAVGYAGLAPLYLQADRPEQARWFAESALRLATEQSSDLAQTYAVLAEACRRLGDESAAKAAEERAAALAASPSG